MRPGLESDVDLGEVVAWVLPRPELSLCDVDEESLELHAFPFVRVGGLFRSLAQGRDGDSRNRHRNGC